MNPFYSIDGFDEANSHYEDRHPDDAGQVTEHDDIHEPEDDEGER